MGGEKQIPATSPGILQQLKKTSLTHLLPFLSGCHPLIYMPLWKPKKKRKTYKFEHVPVKDVIVGESLAVEEIPEQLRAAKIQVRGELGCRKNNKTKQKIEQRMRKSISCCDQSECLNKN
uniref:Uncharacterized protein n=1 Tax=Xiphophorus maculatus TaxID=8083 RepID=A0A3B5QLQ8_XIPMA